MKTLHNCTFTVALINNRFKYLKAVSIGDDNNNNGVYFCSDNNRKFCVMTRFYVKKKTFYY